MKTTRTGFLFSLFMTGLGLFFFNCLGEKAVPATCLRLRWTPAYDGQDKTQLELGLKWSFSYLGAGLPEGCMQKAIQYLGNDQFDLDLNELGFTPQALQALAVIILRIKASEEYIHFGALDVGRFLMLTLHSSWHYYEITGMPRTLDEFYRMHHFKPQAIFAVSQSGVSNMNRLIQIQVDEDLAKMAFVAIETRESPDSFWVADHYEVLDILPNGQPRFALYDKDGNLAAASFSNAGKPTKCLWCHESKIQPLFGYTPDWPGYTGADVFQGLVGEANSILNEYRQGLKSELDFTALQDHTANELLYISFMEPSLNRLSWEWGQPLKLVQNALQGNETHIYAEFPFLGELYHRRTVDSLAPFEYLGVPASAREPGTWEPNYFR